MLPFCRSKNLDWKEAPMHKVNALTQTAHTQVIQLCLGWVCPHFLTWKCGRGCAQSLRGLFNSRCSTPRIPGNPVTGSVQSLTAKDLRAIVHNPVTHRHLWPVRKIRRSIFRCKKLHFLYLRSGTSRILGSIRREKPCERLTLIYIRMKT